MKKWHTIKNLTTICSSKFLEILRFCLKDNNYFMYDNKIYNQIHGMPMGNPLSPTIADVVLDNLLGDAIMKLKDKNIRIKYIAKYVDDILAIIDAKDKDEILNTLNDHHPKIKFTMEIEKNMTIAYLDTKLRRQTGGIIFDWYSKETASGRLMNFNTTQPKSQILNTAKNFIERILSISDEQFHDANIQKINQILTDNSFPKYIIRSLIESTKHRLKAKKQHDNTNIEKKQTFYSVQYIPGLTNRRNMKNIINNNNINFAYKPNLTLNAIFTNVKAPIKKQQNNVVYRIACNGNDEQKCNLIYIGTTKRTLAIRIGEHKMDINKRKETTALAQHILDTGHTADFDNIKILDKENIERKRYTKESLHIQKEIEHTMNLKEDTDKINNCYSVALK